MNKIQAGTLKVDIVDKNGTSIKGGTMNFVNANGSNDILWEPGVTFKTTGFKVKNIGNLALKFKLAINGATGNSELLQVITFSVVNKEGKEVDLGSFEGHLNKKDDVSDELYIQGHMEETAGNDYQGKELNGLGITVLATQYTYENDSTGPDYDAEAQYPSVVTVTPDTIPSPFQANTTYYFEAGEYGDPHFVITDRENVTLIGKAGANFDTLQISSIDYVSDEHNQKVDLDNSTLTVKGFNVANVLEIGVCDKMVVVEGNTAGSIKIKTTAAETTNGAGSCDSILVNNNKLTGGDLGGGSVTKYGVYIVPNITDYDLTVTNNTFENIVKHAIGVQGYGEGSAVTAAKSITVKANTFTSYGTDGDSRAAFKIWADTKLAPNDTDPLNDAAKALAADVKAKNTFAEGLGSNCVVADFYGKTVAFN